MKSYYTW